MIRKKLQVLVFISVLLALATALIANSSMRSIQASSDRRVELAHFIRNHLQADMMHDAIHADVLNAMREAAQYNVAGVKNASQSLEENAQQMKQSLEANFQLPLEADLKQQLQELLPAMGSYVERGRALVTAAEKDPLLAERQFAQFEQDFESLEARMGGISDLADTKTQTIQQSEAAQIARGDVLLLVVSALMLISLGWTAMSIFKRLLTPLQSSIQEMVQLSQGNLNVEISGLEKKDEIGAMARAMQIFKENAQKNLALEEERIAGQVRAQEEKKEAMQELAQRFEQRIQGIISSVAAASTELLQTAQALSGAIEDANDKAHSVARSADATTGNVQTVASAAEEMTASVKEISSQVSKSTQVVADTVAKAEHADSNAKELEGAAQQIGHVVQLIQDIAEQINLLALNATIESARAGDAGKGFAVVASEVKNLATQTTKATEEIATQIEGIQVISKSVVEALNAIKSSIDHVSEYAGGIASAVEEQSAVTDEIAANMQTAAAGTNDIRTNINEVTSKASSAKEASLSVLEASQSLSREAETLSREVAEFLFEIRH